MYTLKHYVSFYCIMILFKNNIKFVSNIKSAPVKCCKSLSIAQKFDFVFKAKYKDKLDISNKSKLI